MANQQVVGDKGAAQKCDIRTQVRKSENKFLFFFFFKARPMSQVNYQAAYKIFIIYMLEMDMDMDLVQT